MDIDGLLNYINPCVLYVSIFFLSSILTRFLNSDVDKMVFKLFLLYSGQVKFQ